MILFWSLGLVGFHFFLIFMASNNLTLFVSVYIFRMATIYAISELALSIVLQYLNSLDLANAAQVCKMLFGSVRIGDAVKFQVQTVYSRICTMKIDDLRLVPGVLFIYETKASIAALSAAQPLEQIGYWVSTIWVSTAKKYYESRRLPNTEEYSLSSRPVKFRGKQSIWKQPGRKAACCDKQVFPALSMTADLACVHGNLAPTTVSKSKRRLVTSKIWHFLRKQFYKGPVFRSTDESCPLCNVAVGTMKIQSRDERNELRTIRKLQLVPEQLERLSARKNGVPYGVSSNLWGSSGEVENEHSSDMHHDSTQSPHQRSALIASMTDSVGTPTKFISPMHQSSSASAGDFLRDDVISVVEAGSLTSVLPEMQWSRVVQSCSPGLSLSCSQQNKSTVTPVRAEYYEDLEDDQEAINLALAMSLSMHQQPEWEEVPCGLSSCDELATVMDKLPMVSSADIDAKGSIDTKKDTQPLVPGIYHIIPRTWLKSWRQLSRNAESNIGKLLPLDCTNLLCSLHGNLIIPPHLEEYLAGFRRNLLGNLGDYPVGGEIVEIVSVEEWDELQAMMLLHYPAASGCDFNIRFCLDGETVSWNVPVCRFCDPFNYHGINLPKRGPNSQQQK